MADTIRDADAPLHSTHNHRQPTEHTAAPAFGLHHGPRGRWLCDFYAGRNRIRRSTGTRDLAEAVRICARWLDGGLEALPRPRALQHTLADVAERIAEEHRDGRLSAGSVRLYHDRIAFFRAWHLRTCGHEAVLHRLDAAVIRRYIAWRQVTPVTRNGRAQGDRRPSPPQRQ